MSIAEEEGLEVPPVFSANILMHSQHPCAFENKYISLIFTFAGKKMKLLSGLFKYV